MADFFGERIISDQRWFLCLDVTKRLFRKYTQLQRSVKYVGELYTRKKPSFAYGETGRITYVQQYLGNGRSIMILYGHSKRSLVAAYARRTKSSFLVATPHRLQGSLKLPRAASVWVRSSFASMVFSRPYTKQLLPIQITEKSNS